MIYGTFIQSPYFWYFISGRQNTPPFFVFIVSGVSQTQIIKGKIPRQFFFGRRAMERRPKRERSRGPKGVGPRNRYRGHVGPTKRGLGHFLAWAFLGTPSSSPKRDVLIFPELSEAMAAAQLLILSEGGQILLLRSFEIGRASCRERV